MLDSEIAETVLRRQGQMESERGTWEGHWTEVAERVLPRQSDFHGQKRVGGEKLTDKIFDSTAPLGLERFAAAMDSLLTPRAQRWHELVIPEVGDDVPPSVAQYLHDVTTKLFLARYSPAANFASQAHETYIGLGAFGSGAMFVDDMLGRGIRYRSIAMAELFFSENFQGLVDTIHRKFEWTARQAKQKFGDALPESILKAAERSPERKFEFIHCVQPRDEVEPWRYDFRGMRFASYYLSIEGKKLLGQGGYRTMPYAVSRYVTAPREVYGRSPAMTVLADIKTVNEQSKTLLRAGQLSAEPPILLSDDGSLSPFKLQSLALNYGALDSQGNELAKPFQTGANMPITREMMQDGRAVINDAFLVTLFRILVDDPTMTATQAMLRAQEKGELLTPTVGRQQSEFLGPLIDREIDILSMAGVLPTPPDEFLQMGNEVHYRYDSPMSRAQRAGEGVAIMNTVSQAMELAQVDPSALHAIKVPETMVELGKINGMPAKLLRTPDELAEMAAAAQQAQQMQNILGAAGPASEAAKNFAQAGALAAAAPNTQAPNIFPAVR